MWDDANILELDSGEGSTLEYICEYTVNILEATKMYI